MLSLPVAHEDRRVRPNPPCCVHLAATFYRLAPFKTFLVLMMILSSLGGVGWARAVDSIRVQAILVADRLGGGAATVTPQQITASLAYATQVYAPAGIEFTFDPASDVARVNNDLLYYDCTLSPMADMNAPKEVPPACDPKPNNDERNRIAQFYPGKLVVYFSVGIRPRYDTTARKWKMDAPRGGNWSNHLDRFVLMNPGNPGGELLAHEVGHYLHLVHPMGPLPRCLNDQITADGKPALGPDDNPICLDDPVVGGKPVLGPDGEPELAARNLVHDYIVTHRLPKADGMNVFDNDKDICGGNPTILCVHDTAPDPGSDLFRAAGLDPCNPNHGTLSFEVSYADGPFTYTFMPDRSNVMSYWNKSCQGVQATVTPDQVAGVRAAITTMNRQHLIQKKVLYTAVWEPGDRSTSRAIGWTFADFPTRFDQEIAAGKHLVHMQAYDIGGGRIRYDGVWEDGARGTTRAIGWGLHDLAGRFRRELAAGKHLVHMQAYDIGGGRIRYDAVWEDGDQGTTFAIGWGEDLIPRFNQEIAAGRHLAHMQAYDIGGGQIRYDAVWEAGARGTDWVRGWGFNDLVRHLEEETAVGRTLVHLQGYDIGDGQLRFDAVWEVNTSVQLQTRVLAETIYPFAVRFNQETQQGRHLRFMQTVVGR